MITYINKENAAKYQALFQKAQDVLTANGQVFDASSDNPALQPITTLEQYFAYLKTLANTVDASNPNIGRYFTRLPLDEDFFEINANTRKITIPADFSKNGIAVRGDELAEVVYFTIDRFFDATDLAHSDMNIAIQWTNGTVSGVSRNYGKDIETIPGKIIFGWPISSELTANPGTIKFSVRFYKIIEETNNDYTFSYSLNTLPAEVKVNDTLSTFNSSLDVIDHGDDLVNRLVNSTVYDPSITPPEAPIFIVDLSEDAQNDIKFVDLDNNGEFVFAASAVAPTGYLTYNWKKYAYSNGVTGSAPADATNNAANINQTDYRACEFEEDQEIDDLMDAGHMFYYVADEGTTPPTYRSFSAEGAVATGEENKVLVNETEYALFERYSTCKVNTVGAYFVNAEARVGTSSSTAQSKIVTIPDPQNPVINTIENSDYVKSFENDNIIHVKLNAEGAATLPISATVPEKTATGRSEKENDNPKVSIAYQWFSTYGTEEDEVSTSDVNLMIPTDSEEARAAAGTAGEVTEENGIFASSLAITGMTAANTDLLYQAKATSARNGATASTDSLVYRVTSAPARPVISYNGSFMNYTGTYANAAAEIEGTDAIENGTGEVSKNAENVIEPRLRTGRYTLAFSINTSIQHDKFTYVWMKANIEDSEEDDFWSESNLKKLQVDVDNALNGLFKNKAGNPDIPAVEGTNLDVRSILEETGEAVEGSENGPALLLDSTASGVYYCIVVNELNEFIAVNASPFFRIG